MTVDGVALVTGNRILLKDQSTASENGIYVVQASGAPLRATDADVNAEVTGGMFTFVEKGTANANSGFVLATATAIVVGTTGLSFVQFSGAGQITAGAALLKTGNTLDVRVDDSSVEVSVDKLQVKALGITNAMIAATTIDLTAKVTGTLPVTNGGTGLATITANHLVYGNGSSAVTTLTPGTFASGVGQILSVNAAGTPVWTNTIDGGTF
jgi:phage-related tail fiber protein